MNPETSFQKVSLVVNFANDGLYELMLKKLEKYQNFRKKRPNQDIPFIIYQERTAHSKNLKIGENIAYEMLKRSIKRILGFYEIFARNKKFKFFGQLIKSILQSVNDEEKLTNELRNLVILYNSMIAKLAQC